MTWDNVGTQITGGGKRHTGAGGASTLGNQGLNQGPIGGTKTKGFGGTVTGSTVTPTPTPTSDGTGVSPDNNAYTVMMGILDQYGLASLASVVMGYIKEGYTSDAINVLIQQTPEWKQRFAGNEIRTKAGLAPLDPATYLATEAAYAQAIKAAGLPAGYYDGGADFANWIGGDVSATEVQQRANDAAVLIDSTDSASQQALQNYYGIDKGHIAAHFLDQKTALPILQQQAAAASVGGAAIRQGLSVSEGRANEFAKLGVTGQQANSDYQQIAEGLPGEQNLAAIYHQAYGQQDFEDELLGSSGTAALKRKALNDQEKASFSGSGAAGSTSSLGQQTSGKF